MFSGINIENLNALIRKNNFYVDPIVKNKKALIGIINELNSSYDGKSLDYLFSNIFYEARNIENIPVVVESYSTVLYKIVKDYQNQDLNAKVQINNSSKLLNREVEKK